MKPERNLAKCDGFDFIIEDHGMPFLSGSFTYEEPGWGTQGFGYVVDTAFMYRLLNAVGVHSLKDLKGKSCWVTHTHDNISKVEPLHKKDGETFDIEKWKEWHKDNPGMTCPMRAEDQKKKLVRR
jgi:hypothetical protein